MVSRFALPVLMLAPAVLVARPARADFLDDARRTFTRDIPHFFQDDVPCTFGGQPTSGARLACKQDKPPARPPSRPAPQPARAADPPVRR